MDRIHIVVFFIINTCVENESWQGPSFISEWYGIQSQDEHHSVVNIQHTLNELPAKVDVQIKVVADGIDYIFTGTGSAQRDDDYAEEYGGVVYIYNELHVHLYFPFMNDGYDTGGVAFTGSYTDYDGPVTPVQGRHNTAHARIRAWRQSDFPSPLFSYSVSINNKEDGCYKEIHHGSNTYPDMVTAQVLLHDGHISDGQGALFQQDTDNDFNEFGGLIYGYDNTKVRLWVPKQSGTLHNGLVFSRCDGWGGAGCGFDSGNVTVRGYVLSSDVVFEQSFQAGKDIISSPDNIAFSSVYSIDSSLVSVQVKQDFNGDNNDGFVFSGAGSAVSTGKIFGGVIYVYTNDSALLWTPKLGRGYMIYIGNRWGDGKMSSAQQTATIIIKVFADLKCPNPDIIPNAQYYVSSLNPGGTVTYACDPTYTYMYGNLVRVCNGGVWGGILPTCSKINCSEATVAPFSNVCMDPGGVVHGTYTMHGLTVGDNVTYVCDGGYMYTDGNLVRTCQLFGNWSGVPPVCSAIPTIACQDPGGVTNASYSITGLSMGSTVTYACDSGYQYEAGYLTRSCQSDGTWDGVPPVCSVIPSIECVDPGSVANASYMSTGLTIGSVVTYACDPGYQYEAGFLTRTCLSNGTWDGVPPVCSVVRCVDPGEVVNGTYTLTGHYPGDTATYTCSAGSTQKGGDSVRSCQVDGTWDGKPIVCVVSVTSSDECLDPGDVANATYTITGLSIGSTVTYMCDLGYQYEAGYLTRSCQSDSTWDGVPPVCSVIPVIECIDPGKVANASYTITGHSVGSTVAYVCDPGYQYEAGYLTRVCQSDGTWDGVPPVCSVVKCVDPGEVVNGTYTITGHYPGDTATYTCSAGSTQKGGDSVRSCQVDGTWDGKPIVCVVSGTCGYTPVVYTPDTLDKSLKNLKKKLTVDTKKTSSYRRSLVCAQDERPSSTYIGSAGGILLCGLVAVLVIPDLFMLVGHIKNFTNIYNKTSKYTKK